MDHFITGQRGQSGYERRFVGKRDRDGWLETNSCHSICT